MAKPIQIGLIVNEIHPLVQAIQHAIESNSSSLAKCDLLNWKKVFSSDIKKYNAIYLDRMGENTFSYATQILLLDEFRHIMPNAPFEYFRARDKALTFRHFTIHNIPHPQTSISCDLDDLKIEIDRGPEWQLLKSIQGVCANEVVAFAKSDFPEDFASKILLRDALILRQDFVNGAKDYIWRIDIVNQRIIVANKRYRFTSCGPSICNGTHGGHVEFYDPSDVPVEIASLALRATQCLGLRVSGVDILEGSEDIFVLEVNPEPDITLDRLEFPKAIAAHLIGLANQSSEV